MRMPSFAAVLSALALTVACSQTDAGVTTSVKTRLATDDQVKARNIDVDTKNHVVTLTGQVQSSQEKTKAVDIARRTSGVTDVVDNLTIIATPEPAATSGTSTTPATPDLLSDRSLLDPGITADIKARLLADPKVSGLKI